MKKVKEPMNIDDLTIGQAREIAALFEAAAGTVNAFQQEQTNQPIVGKHPMLDKHCVVRTYSAGVHIGRVSSVDGTEVLLTEARRIYKWEGAFTLSEVAVNGINSSSKLAVEVPETFLTQVIEFIPTTEKARESYGKCCA